MHIDDILRKNIFNDEDLRKLSPDYNPKNITLRMQVRRTMFKDIHNHSFLKNRNWHRKSIKRTKDGYKINKEIAKMRNDFRSINLRNQIIMKSDLKQTTVKSEVIKYSEELLLNDINILNDDTEQCIQDLQEDMAKLVLTNDSNFKIGSKQQSEKPNTDCYTYIKGRKSCSKKQDEYVTKIKKTETDNYQEDTEQSIRVECAFAYKSSKLSENSQIHEDIDTQINDDECKNHPENITDKNPTEDLQTLLIMMALTKSNSEVQSPKIFVANSNHSPQNMEKDKECDNRLLLQNTKDGDITKSLHIAQIKIEMNERQTYLIEKYLKKWKAYVSNKKEYINKQKEDTLNNFFDKLSKKKLESMQSTPEYNNKAKWFGQDYNTYQHRYRVQKHIIALQKAKLEEQNRLIEELKYNRIVEASRESVDTLKEQVRKTYFDIDRQLKPKIKCLTNELKIKEIEEPSLVLQCLKVPRFLQRMEKRAREREEKHAMIRERRIQMEEERIRLKQQAELAKAEMDKEEKMKRIKELHEKRKKEKVETIRKKQYAARLRALIVMADLHYERTLMAKYGIRPLRILLQIKRDNMLKAKLHYNFQLKKNVFLHWMWYTEDMLYERNFMAEDFHRKKLLRKYFNGFKQNVRSYIIKKQVADDYYDLYVQQLVFRKFREAILMVQKENELKYQMAVLYYNSNITFKVLTCWRTLPALNALKREQEARKAKWREKVLLVVPDYTPPDD